VVNRIEKLASVFADSRVVRTINNALINLIPFVFVGAISVAVLNLPIPAYQEALDGLFGEQWRLFSRVVSFASLGSIAVATLLLVAHTYALDEPSVKNGDIHPVIPTFVAFACYVIIFVWDGRTSIDFSTPGRAGVFASLATALVSAWLFFRFVRLWTRIRPPRPSLVDVNLQMRPAFRAAFPVAATLVIFGLIRTLLPILAPVQVVPAAFLDFVNTCLISDDLGSVLLTVLLSQFFWFFGAHGSGLIIDNFPLVSEVSGSAQALFATRDFYLNFVSLGGTGATLGLLIALFLVGSRHRGKRLAWASLFPAALNVNEPLLYGTPIILSPFFFLPFLFGPLLAASISYVAFSVGLVPPITEHLNWTTPVLISGYLSTGSLAGSLLQVVCVAVTTVLYLPFVISVRNYERRRRMECARLLQQEVLTAVDSGCATVLFREDDVGKTARELCVRLTDYFETGILPLYLVYQPKTSADGRVIGAEALLRWEHPELGSISPVVLVELCDEGGLTTKLGRWVTKEAIAEYARWKRDGVIGGGNVVGNVVGSTDSNQGGMSGKDAGGVGSRSGGAADSNQGGMSISINLNTRQLGVDEDFPAFLAETLAAYGVEGREVELEITEHMALRVNEANKQALAAIRDLGVELSIDDMGMGYSSLSYISEFGVRGVKIDISLVDVITTDLQQQEIVRSIVQLAEQLDLTVVVEGVEDKEQVDALTELGVRFFQGYYFSKPCEREDFCAYVKENGIFPQAVVS
jgi:lactose/cellobiose-specific phosphotransferase system IIC component